MQLNRVECAGIFFFVLRRLIWSVLLGTRNAARRFEFQRLSVFGGKALLQRPSFRVPLTEAHQLITLLSSSKLRLLVDGESTSLLPLHSDYGCSPLIENNPRYSDRGKWGGEGGETRSVARTFFFSRFLFSYLLFFPSSKIILAAFLKSSSAPWRGKARIVSGSDNAEGTRATENPTSMTQKLHISTLCRLDPFYLISSPSLTACLGVFSSFLSPLSLSFSISPTLFIFSECRCSPSLLLFLALLVLPRRGVTKRTKSQNSIAKIWNSTLDKSWQSLLKNGFLLQR